MKITKRLIIMYIFMGMLLFACFPYLFYGFKTMSSDNSIIGSITRNNINVGPIGKNFVYIKDVLACLLLLILLPKLRRNMVIISLLVWSYGILILLITDRFEFVYVIAGFRTYLFAFVTYLYWKTHVVDQKSLKYLCFIVELGIIVETIVVIGQILASGSLSTFGNGAYRYSGAFADSGNLGTFSIAATLFLIVIFKKFRMISSFKLVSYLFALMFLTVASGTRTAIFLVVFFFLYIVIFTFGKKLRLNRTLIILGFIGILFVCGNTIFNLIIDRIGRGALMDSGSGRLGVFENLMNYGSLIEILFGNGIGFGTNASIILGATDSIISDATLNFILAQFGILGVILFIVASIYIFYCLLNLSKLNKDLVYMSLIIFIVFCLVGNLFEQIGMVIIYISTLFLLFINKSIIEL